MPLAMSFLSWDLPTMADGLQKGERMAETVWTAPHHPLLTEEGDGNPQSSPHDTPSIQGLLRLQALDLRHPLPLLSLPAKLTRWWVANITISLCEETAIGGVPPLSTVLRGPSKQKGVPLCMPGSLERSKPLPHNRSSLQSPPACCRAWVNGENYH